MSKILLVEDDPVTIKLMTNILKQEGHGVTTAGDGMEGLLALREKPDLLIMDIMMPNFDGMSMINTVRDEDLLSLSRVIVISSRVDLKEKLIRVGIRFVLPKPVNTARLLSIIKEILAKPQP